MTKRIPIPQVAPNTTYEVELAYRDKNGILSAFSPIGTGVTDMSVDFSTVSGPTKPADNATVGARVGTNIFPGSGSTPLPGTQLLNSEIGIDANGRLTNTGTGSAIVDNGRITIDGNGRLTTTGTGSAIVDNGRITIDALGRLTTTGTGSVVVDNSKITLGTLGFTGATDATRNVVSTGLLSARPTGVDGDMFFATDDNNGAGLLYTKIAGAWVADPKAKVLFDNLTTTVNANEATNSSFRSSQASNNSAQAASLTTLEARSYVKGNQVRGSRPNLDSANPNNLFARFGWQNQGLWNVNYSNFVDGPFLSQSLTSQTNYNWFALNANAVPVSPGIAVSAQAMLGKFGTWAAGTIGIVIYWYSDPEGTTLVSGATNGVVQNWEDGLVIQGQNANARWVRTPNQIAPTGAQSCRLGVYTANATGNGVYTEAGAWMLKLEYGSTCTAWTDEAMPLEIDARVRTEESARASADSALATRATTLEATVNNGTTGVAATAARLTTEESTRASADSALATRATNLESTVNNATTGVAATAARLTTEEGTRATADTALAGRATALEATVNNATTGVAATAARLTTEEGTRASADTALAARATTLEATVNDGTTGLVATRARLVTEEGTRATADTALATRATTLEAQMANTSGSGLQSRISTEESARASADSALATRATTLEARFSAPFVNLVRNSSGEYGVFAAGANPAEGNWWLTDTAIVLGIASAADTTGGVHRFLADFTTPQNQNFYSIAFENYGSNMVFGGSFYNNRTAGNFQFQIFGYTAGGAPYGAISTRDKDGNDATTAYLIPPTASWTQVERRVIPSDIPSGCTHFRIVIQWVGYTGYSGFTRLQGHYGTVLPPFSVNTGDPASVNARIVSEESARASADSALATRATNLEATVNNGTTGVAATAARLTTEETTRASADAVLATRATTLEATVNNGTTGVAATAARLTTEESARASGDAANASQITTLTARSYVKGNLVKGSRPNYDPSSYNALFSRFGWLFQGLWNVNYSPYVDGPYLSQSLNFQSNYTWGGLATNAMPIVAGLPVSVQAILGKFGTWVTGTLQLQIYWYSDTAGTSFHSGGPSKNWESGIAVAGQIQSASARWVDIANAVAPSGVQSFRLGINTINATGNGSYTEGGAWMLKAEYGTTCTAWTDDTLPLEIDARVTSVNSVAVDGRGRAYAISGTQTEVNGRKGGFVMDNDGSVTNFQITADDFRIYQSVGGANIVPFRVVGGQTQINDALVRTLNVIPDGGGPSHRVQLRPNSLSGADGASFTFSPAYGGIPLIRPVVLQPPALAAGETYDISATSLSASGFTVRAKKFTPGTPTAQSSGAGSNVGGTPAWQAEKPTSADADGNAYTYSWTATLPRVSNEFMGSNTWYAEYQGEFDVYYNAGSGWVYAYSTYLSFASFYTGSSPSTVTGQGGATTAVLPAIGQHGGNEFGLHAVSGTITAFAGVTYTTTSQSSVVSLPGNFTFDIYPPT